MLASTVWYLPLARSGSPAASCTRVGLGVVLGGRTAASSMSTASTRRRRTWPRRWPGCRSRSRSRARAGPAAPGARSSAGTCGWSDGCRCRRPGRGRAGSPAGLRRRLVPGRHDPEGGRDLHRLELRLREAHPVLLGTSSMPSTCAPAKKSCACSSAPLLRARLGGNSATTGALPALLGRRHAGLAEQGLLGIGVCASASSTETLSASSASSASLTASTRSSGRAGATRTCGRSPQRLCCDSHSSR
jgi:hypothetical protein